MKRYLLKRVTTGLLTVLIAISVSVVTMIVDILYAWLDSRIRLK